MLLLYLIQLLGDLSGKNSNQPGHDFRPDRDRDWDYQFTGTGTNNFYLTGTGTNNPILPGPGWPEYDRNMSGMTGNPGKNPGKLEWLTGTGTKNPELTGTGIKKSAFDLDRHQKCNLAGTGTAQNCQSRYRDSRYRESRSITGRTLLIKCLPYYLFVHLIKLIHFYFFNTKQAVFLF